MRLLRLFSGRARREAELKEEIDAHFAMAVRDRIERGESPQDAEVAVRREFGNRTLVQETTRGLWSGRYLDELGQDLRYAFRGMRASPGVTAIIVGSLALGIGANTAIFSLVYSVMLRTLPVSHPEQLVELLQKYPGEPRGNGYWTARSYEHFRDHNHVFSFLTGTATDYRAEVRVEGSEPETVVAEFVEPNYFEALGLKSALGRFPGPEYDPAKPEGTVAVVSWSVWDRRFGKDPNAVGRQILVDEKPVAIIGVAPREFIGLRVNAKADVWLPFQPSRGLNLLGRLKPGVSIDQARAEMASLYQFTIDERSAQSNDPLVRQLRIELEPAGAGLSAVRDRVGKPLSVLMAIVCVMLLLACVNVAGLLLARGAGRAREMSLRLGLGAGRWRLMRQVLTEALLLSTLGTLAGVGIAYLGTVAVLRIMDSAREHERMYLQVRPDGNLLLFAAGVAVLTGLLFGIMPAVSAFRSNPATALRQAGRSLETPFNRLFGRSLVAAQVALSLVLVSAGGLFIIHLANLKTADLGFRRDHVLLVNLDPARGGYRGERLSRLYRQLLDRLQAIPGVRSVSLSAPTPLQGAGASGFGTAEGYEEREEDRRRISIAWVAPKYFETMATPLFAGREFTFQDQANPRMAIINRSLERYYFNGRNPIGKRITLDHVTGTREPATYEIVGVAGDANYLEIREPERRLIYLPAFREARVTAGVFVIRTHVDPESIAGDVRRVVHEAEPALPVREITTLADQIDATIVPERLMATFAGFFAALGALIAGIGLFGLLAYTVTRRTNEIGVRIALGATSGRVIRMMLRETVVIGAAGLALGIPLAIWGRRLASSLVEELSAGPGTPLALGTAAILAVALLASYVPARRASRIDPMEALRHE